MANTRTTWVKYTFGCFLFLSSCATYRAQNCTENAGYEKGMNDAKMGRLMAAGQFAVFCSENDVETAQKGYRAGYEAGKATVGGHQLNLSFDNGKVGLVGAYVCRLNYRGETFTDQASSEPLARNNVIGKCDKVHKSCQHLEREVSCAKQ
jgi:hypothetical protein